MNELEIMLSKRGGLEGALLGALFNDITLLEEFNIKEDLFMKSESKIYFKILSILSSKRIAEVTDTDIRLHCPDTLKEAYENNGGYTVIENLRREVSEDNFESYLDDLQKQNYILKLKEEGLNLDNSIEIKLKGRVIRKTYLEIFKPMTCEECVAFMSNRQNTLVDYINKNGIDEYSGEIGDDFLDVLDSGETVGTPMDTVDIEENSIRFMPNISRETLGYSPGTLSLVASFVNCGKTTFVTNLALSLVSKGENVLIICNESKVRDFHINFISYIIVNILKNYSLNKKRLKLGNFTPEEKLTVNKARAIYNKYFADNIHLVMLPDANMSVVESMIRKYVFTKEITCFMYDTLKMDFESAGEVDYKNLIKDSRKLDKLTKIYNIIGIATAQISQTYYGELCLDLNMLAGSRQINEVCENIIMFRNVFLTELDKDSKYYMKPFQRIKDPITDEWEEREMDLDPSQTYRIMYLTKTRSGVTFSDTGTAILTHFNARSCTFQEIGYVKPVRGSVNTRYYK